jgi:hypothetical protein
MCPKKGNFKIEKSNLIRNLFPVDSGGKILLSSSYFTARMQNENK